MDRTAFVGSLLVMVTLSFPAGAGAPKLMLTEVSRSKPTVGPLRLISGPVTVAVRL